MSETLRKYGAKYNTTFCSLCGLSTDTKPTGSFDGVGIANGSEFIEMDTGKKYMYDAESSVWNEVSSGGGGGSTLIEKSISANGVYNASDDSADGYSKVTVDVPNTYTAQDEGKVVSNGALVAQTTHAEITENGTYDITTNNSVSVNVSATSVNNAYYKNNPKNFTAYNLESITIPNGVTSIGSSGFSSFIYLKNVEIPSGVTLIDNSAFKSCSALTTINIPNTVQSIQGSAFRGCNKLENIEIPNSVITIANQAFRDCTSLQSIKFLSTTPPTLGDQYVFLNVPATCIIYVPTGSLSAYTSAAYYPDPNTYTYVEY